MAQIKPEIKVDSAESPINMDNIDEFDEALDLQFPSQSEQDTGAWLVKVSEQMWKAWNDMYQNQAQDEEPIFPTQQGGPTGLQVGTLRVYRQKPGETHQRVQIRLKRGKDTAQTKKLWSQSLLPEVYELDLKAAGYNNTVVFSEKDLPGHRTQQPGGGKFATGSKPSGIQAKNERYGQQQQQQQKKPGTYRTAIPKKTALAPPIIHEAIANPVEDDTSMDFFKLQYDAAMNASKKTIFEDWIKKPTKPTGTPFTFGTLTSKPAGNKKKPVQEKAVRMSRNDLLDKLQGLFTEYQYWPLRALRNRLNQPEAWLKEVLEDIAYPMRSGEFAGTYRLNEQSARLLAIDTSANKEGAAPDPDQKSEGQATGDELGEQDDYDDVDDDGDDGDDGDLKTEN